MLRTIWEGFLDLLYPTPIGCVFCGAATTATDFELCATCLAAIEYVTGQTCRICGKPIGTREQLCFDCAHSPRQFHRGFPVALYRGWLKDALYSFKFLQNRELAKPFARLMAGRLRNEASDIDCILPVPMHPRRLRERRYNQAALLAQHLGDMLIKPVYEDVLVRVEETLPQRILKRSEREENLRGAFAVREKTRITQKRILLVDDIFTTGATVDVCSRVLMAEGAKFVRVSVLAIGVDYSRISKNSGE
jgi:competence protein ComFC